MRFRRDERGATAILVAITLVVLLGFLGLAVDVGHFMKVRAELQNSSDAAALAGARELTGAPLCAERARPMAQDFARRHMSDTMHIEVSDPEVELGTMVSDGAGGWTFQRADETLCGQISAIKVTSSRGTASINAAVPVFFSRILNGNATQDISASAVAAVGGPCGECSFPFVISGCMLKDASGNLECDKELILKADKVDTWGITSLDQNYPDELQANAQNAADVINSPSQCKDVQAGQPVPVQNGNDIVAASLRMAIAAFCHVPDPGNGKIAADCYDADGNHPEVMLPIVDECTLTQDPVITGFASLTFVHYDFTTSTPAFTMDNNCKIVDESPKWCPFFGASSTARLYQ